jgi:hypothetical protein
MKPEIIGGIIVGVVVGSTAIFYGISEMRKKGKGKNVNEINPEFSLESQLRKRFEKFNELKNDNENGENLGEMKRLKREYYELSSGNEEIPGGLPKNLSIDGGARKKRKTRKSHKKI